MVAVGSASSPWRPRLGLSLQPWLYDQYQRPVAKPHPFGIKVWGHQMTSIDRGRQWATMTLEWATRALTDAEREGASDEEVVTLCDEVIRARLRVQQCDLDAGWEPPASRRLQIARDRELLAQPAFERRGAYHA